MALYAIGDLHLSASVDKPMGIFGSGWENHEEKLIAAFGALDIDGQHVKRFQEKPHGHGGQINGGFFVLNPNVIELIEHDNQPWEAEPMYELARRGQLAAWMHEGFWQPMDTLRDKIHLEELWQTGNAPWKNW